MYACTRSPAADGSTPMLNRLGMKVKDVNCCQKQFSLVLIIIAAICVFSAGTARAQNNRPGPQRPERQGTPEADRGAATDLPPGDATVVPTTTRPNRTRIPREGKVVLAFNETP